MILQSLAAFSQREGLVEDPLFSYVGVSWAIDLGPNGEFWELIDLRTDSTGKGPKKKQACQMLIPKRPIRPGQQTIPAFLVDNAEYVLGLGEQEEQRQRRATRRARFADTIQAAADATKDPIAAATLKFLRDDSAVEQASTEMQAKKYASQELICFRHDGDFLHDSETLKDYWRAQQTGRPRTNATQCLVCGNKASIARLHTPIKSIPGASTAGVPLVSFNQSAFCSYGWEQSDNAPVCENCVSAYSTALNRCLSSQFPNPRDPESVLLRQAHNLGENLCAVFWSDDSKSAIEETVNSAFRNPQVVKALLETPYHRSTPTGARLRFHCLLLQGAQGRATVRSYVSEPIAEIQSHLRQWFAETDVGLDRSFSIYRILSSLAVKNELNKLPPNLAGDLYIAILFHRRIPYAACQLAVTRNRVLAAVTAERAALIQAWLTRDQKSSERNNYVKLDEDNPSIGYQLGRLLAVCESVQVRRSRERGQQLNKTLVDRYFPAMSTRPALVLGALIRLTKQIESQISKPFFFEAAIADIFTRVTPDIPMTLDLIQQANFALGYYHQKSFNRSAYKENAPQTNDEADPTDEKETN